MGRERKRGKLADLNALLRGRAGVGPGEAFSHAVGDTRALGKVRYVITLDTDTQLRARPRPRWSPPCRIL